MADSEQNERLEIYKLHAELADRVSQRREGANRLYVTLLLGIGIVSYCSNEIWCWRRPRTISDLFRRDLRHIAFSLMVCRHPFLPATQHREVQSPTRVGRKVSVPVFSRGSGIYWQRVKTSTVTGS